MKPKYKYNVEVTDTFSGEANYSWVHRFEIEVDQKCSPVRAAKKVAGWNGIRCAVENYGDMIALRPAGMCQIMFINFAD